MNSSQSLTYHITFFSIVFSFLVMHRISFTSQWTRPMEQWACEALVWSLLFFFADRLNMYSDSPRSLLSCIQYFWPILFSSSPNECPVFCPISALLFFFLLLLSYHYAREQYRYFILNKMLIYVVVVVECISALFGTIDDPWELMKHSWHFWHRYSCWVYSDASQTMATEWSSREFSVIRSWCSCSRENAWSNPFMSHSEHYCSILPETFTFKSSSSDEWCNPMERTTRTFRPSSSSQLT